MDTLSEQERSARMRLIKSSDTKPELVLRRLVWALGYRYRKNSPSVPGHPDLSFIGKKRAVFLHGCFWHRHDCAMGTRAPKSKTQFWNAKFERNVQRDALVAKALEANGWHSLVIWECELRNPANLTRRIKEFLDA
jgi:DNA mismatch endonuclease, patch repair protein